MNERQCLVVLRIEECAPQGLLKPIPYIDLVPLLDDAEGFARAVRGAVAPERDFAAASFAALRRRSGGQILHGEIRPVAGFAGRAAELAAIDTALWARGAAALTDAGLRDNAEVAAVRGLGGIGKSVLARQYAWDNRDRYAGVWWIGAETREQVLGELVALGARLVPGLDEMPDRTKAARLTLDALAQAQGERPWLLIYDNVPEPTVLDHLTPSAGAQVLVTSRWSDWVGRAEEVAVDVFPRPLAMEYLLMRVRKSDAAAGRPGRRARPSAAGAVACTRDVLGDGARFRHLPRDAA